MLMKQNARQAFILLPLMLLLLLLFSACGVGAAETPPPQETPIPTPTPAPTPKPELPDELVGEWTLCISEGELGDGSHIDAFSLSRDGVLTAEGESREGYLVETDEEGIFTFVTNDRHYMLKSVEKGGLALLYNDTQKNLFTSASRQIFYRDFESAELTADNWQEYFETQTVYEVIKNSINRVTAFNVRVFLIPKASLDVLAVKDGTVSVETKPTAYALIDYDVDTYEYFFSNIPRKAEQYGMERFQYSQTPFSARAEFHNYAMDLIRGWAANIYARNESVLEINDSRLIAAVETDFEISIQELSGVLYYRAAPAEEAASDTQE